MKIGLVGAGPAGLACAWRLAVDGHEVHVFEKKTNLDEQGSGILIQPVGQAVLEHWGLYQNLSKLGCRIKRISGTSSYLNRVTVSVEYAAANIGSYALGLDRGVLWRALHKRCVKCGVEIHSTTPVLDLYKVAGGGVVLRSGEGDLDGVYDLIVDASGAFSRLHAHSGYSVQVSTLEYGSLWAKVDLPENSPLAEEEMTLRSFRKNVGVGLMPIGQGLASEPKRAALFFNIKWKDFPYSRISDMPNPATQSFGEWKSGLLQKWPDIAPLLKQLESPDSLYLAKFNQLTVNPPFGENIVFIGDAAHSTNPQLGQGVNMSLVDAEVLSRAIRREDNVANALALYAKQRRAHVFIYQNLARALLPFYQSDNRVALHIRDTFYPLIYKLPMVDVITAKLISGNLGLPFGREGLSSL